MSGPNPTQRLFVACVTVLLAVLALEWAARILQQIWPTLAAVAVVVLIGTGVVALVRWRRSRW